MKSSKKADLFTQLVLEIFKSSGLFNIEGDELTREFGLTSSRWKILGAIHLSNMPLTVPQIARAMGQSRQAVQRLVDVMEKDGLILLADNPNHKRAKYVQLTAKAEKIYRKLDLKQIEWATQSSKNLTLTELETALSVVRKISTRFDT